MLHQANDKLQAVDKHAFEGLKILRAFFMLLTACITLSGCAGAYLARDSAELTGGYAQASNQQMLLNLARLRKDDPPYFLQLSSITTQDQLSSTAAFSPSNVNTLHATAQSAGGIAGLGPSTWTLGGMIGGTTAQNPTFTFVPLNGAAYSDAISVPMSPELFYDCIEQGLPVDIIARIMLCSIDVPVKKLAGTATFKGFDGLGKAIISTPHYKDKNDSGKEAIPVQDASGNYLDAGGDAIIDKNGDFTEEAVIKNKKLNIPITVGNSAVQTGQVVEFYVPDIYPILNDPSSSTYKDFLGWCYNQRLLQENNLLLVLNTPSRETNAPEPTSTYTIKDLKLPELISAEGSGYEVIPKPATNNVYIIKKTTPSSHSFGKVYKSDLTLIKNKYAKYSGTLDALLNETSAVSDFEMHTADGEPIKPQTNKIQPQVDTIQDNVLSLMNITEANSMPESTAVESNTKTGPDGAVFNIRAYNVRTFLAVLRNVAKEECIYKTSNPDDYTFYTADNNRYKANPILILNLPQSRDDKYDLLIHESYRRNDYYIGDSLNPADQHCFFDQANKCVFTILTLLYADITLDPSKLPQPIQVIQ